MAASDHLSRPQFHMTQRPAEFPGTDWVHLGTRQAAMDRSAYVKDQSGPGTKMGMVVAKIRGPVPADHIADEEANQLPYPRYDYDRGEVVHQPPGAHAYVNNFEDPGSTSYVVHRDRVKVVYRGPAS